MQIKIVGALIIGLVIIHGWLLNPDRTVKHKLKCGVIVVLYM
jgi:hypothetical protein